MIGWFITQYTPYKYNQIHRIHQMISSSSLCFLATFEGQCQLGLKKAEQADQSWVGALSRQPSSWDRWDWLGICIYNYISIHIVYICIYITIVVGVPYAVGSKFWDLGDWGLQNFVYEILGTQWLDPYLPMGLRSRCLQPSGAPKTSNV